MEMFIDILLNAGPIGLLAGYAIYSNAQSEKRIEELMAKGEEREERIRERWLSVVQKQDVDKDKLVTELSNKLDEMIRTLERIEEKFKNG